MRPVVCRPVLGVVWWVGLLFALGLGPAVAAQVAGMAWQGDAHLVVPQARAFGPAAGGTALDVTRVDVGVLVVGQVATTTMDIEVSNPGGRAAEARLLVPTPDGVAIRGFDFQGAGAEGSAELMKAEEARRIYDGIVAQSRDPALLEFVGTRLVRSSVFPVPARGTQKVRLTWDQLLEIEDSRIDYVLPRSESLDYRVPWSIHVRVAGVGNISTVYSPSHRVETVRAAPSRVSVRLVSEAATDPGPFRLSWLLERDDVTASLLAYPDPVRGGGWFMLLAGLPVEETAPVRREVTLVIDRSGSMREGGKLDQVKAAARQILEGLRDGERFNVVAYGSTVDQLSVRPVEKDPRSLARAMAFLDALEPGGGTNIHDALVAALTPPAPGDALPLVLFLTDGLPTVGETSERRLRDLVERGNRAGRRIFTIGVGVDVNAPLLTAIASETRAVSSFILPGDDVRGQVAKVFRRLGDPVLASPEVRMVDAGDTTQMRAMDLQPGRLPDLFRGDQVVLLGRYLGDAPVKVQLRGALGGRVRTFSWDFDLDRASVKNAFVPRLWASRRISELVVAIQAAGADGGRATARTDELVKEVVALSTEFGVLTEYTAFFAREGTDLGRPDDVLRQAMRNFDERALRTRWGVGSVNQSVNNESLRAQSNLNYRNRYVDQNMQAVETTAVRQVADRAYFRAADGNWVDGRILNRGAGAAAPDRVVRWGSRAYDGLLAMLSAQGRQGALSLAGSVVLDVDGQSVLVEGPTAN